jgi:DNA processing protein
MQQHNLASFLHIYHCFGRKTAPITRLLEYFNSSPAEFSNLSFNELKAAGIASATIKAIKNKTHARVESDLIWAEQSGNHLICFDDPAYPALLKQIEDPPPLIYASGDINLLQTPQIAIVGSRKCTPGGAQNTREFAFELSRAGLTITSGMALGIDTQAHQAALKAGGNTIAVTGCGLDRIYPASNKKLAQDIVERGLLISEFPMGTAALPGNFPQRNRIISGLSVATLVVEAAQRSGSLITARLAAEQGREVFAIPGSIHNPQTRGCHKLIRDGAKLVEQTSDIIQELGSLLGFVAAQQCEKSSEISTLDKKHKDLLENIGYDPVTVDVLVGRSCLTIDKLSSMLLELELKDLIQSAPGGCFVRI